MSMTMKKRPRRLPAGVAGAFLFPVVLFFLAGFSACSSAPEKPREIFTDRNMAASQLNLANQSAGRGRYEDALLILEDASRLAVSADDPPLIIKTSISRGNILFSLGREDEAFRAWESAVLEGEASGEALLAALARIYTIRARLVLLSHENENPSGGSGGEGSNSAAEEYRTRLEGELAAVKPDALSLAAGYVTLGMAEKELGRWAEAEAAVMEALSIHEKELALEDAAYDWFLIASIRSLPGNHEGALEALSTAIAFDRRAENGFGLASSWQAAGDVRQKAGQTAEARAAWRRAASIYRAIGLTDKALQLEARL